MFCIRAKSVINLAFCLLSYKDLKLKFGNLAFIPYEAGSLLSFFQFLVIGATAPPNNPVLSTVEIAKPFAPRDCNNANQLP